jgi:hypothetical protein
VNQRQCTIVVVVAALFLALAGCLMMPIAGAYARIAKDDEKALAAHTFLREELVKSRPEIVLGQIRVAYRQVVAGYNIRLKCEYRTASDARTRLLTAVVYFDLQGGRKLTQLVLDKRSGK